MNLLITGSSGFIGSTLTNEFSNFGHSISGIDVSKPRLGSVPDEYLNLDIMDDVHLCEYFWKVQPEVVIHLAATHDISDITLEQGGFNSYNVNTKGTQNVINAAMRCGSVRRFIHTSTQMVSLPGHQCCSLDECRPATYYGKSKLESERYFHELQNPPFEWIIVRPTTVWGPGMNPHYQRFLEYVRRGRYFHISNRPLYKSYSYIENIAYQYRILCEAEGSLVASKTFYLSDYSPLSLRDYANLLQEFLGAKKIPVRNERFCKLAARVGDFVSHLGFPRFPFTTFRVNNILNEYTYDLSETEAVTGPLPVSFEEGVRRTAEWYLAKRALVR